MMILKDNIPKKSFVDGEASHITLRDEGMRGWNKAGMVRTRAGDCKLRDERDRTTATNVPPVAFNPRLSTSE